MPKNNTDNTLEEWVEHYIKTEEPRSKSLIISVFGDAISPYSEGIWLGELIQLMEAFDINERLVRTNAFRLSDEGWLTSQKQGRRSFYSLTQSAALNRPTSISISPTTSTGMGSGHWLSCKRTSRPLQSALNCAKSWSGTALVCYQTGYSCTHWRAWILQDRSLSATATRTWR